MFFAGAQGSFTTKRKILASLGSTTRSSQILLYPSSVGKKTTVTKSRERQSLNRAFRAELRLDAGAYTSYGSNTAPSSLIGSKCVDVKGETSHPTLSMFF